MNKKTPMSESISHFIVSATTLDQCPLHKLKEIAVVGRSNVGKSSLLNKILKKDLVKVSQTPGKTQLINFFSKEGKYCLVDLPGYGYAKLSKKTIETWKDMIEGYLLNREQLIGVLLLVDIRRDLQEEEKSLIKIFKKMSLPVIFVFTKIDKLNLSELKKMQNKLSSKYIPSFYTSSLKDKGVFELENYIYRNWILEK
jgi:GTP-binding protein